MTVLLAVTLLSTTVQVTSINSLCWKNNNRLNFKAQFNSNISMNFDVFIVESGNNAIAYSITRHCVVMATALISNLNQAIWIGFINLQELVAEPNSGHGVRQPDPKCFILMDWRFEWAIIGFSNLKCHNSWLLNPNSGHGVRQPDPKICILLDWRFEWAIIGFSNLTSHDLWLLNQPNSGHGVRQPDPKFAQGQSIGSATFRATTPGCWTRYRTWGSATHWNV